METEASASSSIDTLENNIDLSLRIHLDSGEPQPGVDPTDGLRGRGSSRTDTLVVSTFPRDSTSSKDAEVAEVKMLTAVSGNFHDYEAEGEKCGGNLDRMDLLEGQLRQMKMIFQDLETKFDDVLQQHRALDRKYSDLKAHCRRVEERQGMNRRDATHIERLQFERQGRASAFGSDRTSSSSDKSKDSIDYSNGSSPQQCQDSLTSRESRSGSKSSVGSTSSGYGRIQDIIRSSSEEPLRMYPRSPPGRPPIKRSNLSDMSIESRHYSPELTGGRSSSAPSRVLGQPGGGSQKPSRAPSVENHSQSSSPSRRPHHSSRHPSQEDFLAHLNPEIGGLSYNAFPQWPSIHLNLNGREANHKSKVRGNIRNSNPSPSPLLELAKSSPQH